MSVVLVAMPWLTLDFPSVQLGTLKAVLDREQIPCSVRTYSLALMEFFAQQTKGLPESERITTDDYRDVAQNLYSVGLGDWIFAVPPYRDPDPALDEKYLSYVRTEGHVGYVTDATQRGIAEARIAKALQMRRLVPAF